MGCGSSVEDQVLLAKLDRLEVQVKKEKELKKLSEMEGRPIKSLEQYNGFDTISENKRRMKSTNDRYIDTYTNKDKVKRKKKKGASEKKSKKKKDKDEKSKKKTRAVSEGVKKKKKKK